MRSNQQRYFPRVLLLLAGALAACDGGTPPERVGSVQVTPVQSTLLPDDTLHLGAVVYNEDGEVMTGRGVEWSSDNVGVASVSSGGIVTAKVAGTATILASVGGAQDGAVIEVVEDPVEGCPVSPIAIGGTATGALAAGDCAFADGTGVDFYELRLTTARSVTITLRSSAFDAYLVLYTRMGAGVDEDDDGAGGTDSRLTITLQPGRYLIGANSYSPATGPYTLSVS